MSVTFNSIMVIKRTILFAITVFLAVGCTDRQTGSDSGFFCGVLTSNGDRMLLLDCATAEPLMVKGGADFEKAVSLYRGLKEGEGTAYIHFYGTIERVELQNGSRIVSSVSVDKFEDMYPGVTCNQNAVLTSLPFVSDTDTVSLRSDYTYVKWSGDRGNRDTGKWIRVASDQGMFYSDRGGIEEFDMIIGPDGSYNGLVLRMNINGRETNLFPM